MIAMLSLRVAHEWRCPQCSFNSPLPSVWTDRTTLRCARCGSAVLEEASSDLERNLLTAAVRALFETASSEVASGSRAKGWRLVTRYERTDVQATNPLVPVTSDAIEPFRRHSALLSVAFCVPTAAEPVSAASATPSSAQTVKCSQCGATLTWAPETFVRSAPCTFCSATNVIAESVWLQAVAALPEAWFEATFDADQLTKVAVQVIRQELELGATHFRALDVMAVANNEDISQGLATTVVDDYAMGGDLSRFPQLSQDSQLAIVRALAQKAEGPHGRIPFRYSNLQKALLSTLQSSDVLAQIPIGNENETSIRDNILAALGNRHVPMAAIVTSLRALGGVDETSDQTTERGFSEAQRPLLQARLRHEDVSEEELMALVTAPIDRRIREEAALHERFPVAKLDSLPTGTELLLLQRSDLPIPLIEQLLSTKNLAKSVRESALAHPNAPKPRGWLKRLLG